MTSGLWTSTFLEPPQAESIAAPVSLHISGDLKGKFLSARLASTLKVFASAIYGIKSVFTVFMILSMSFSVSIAISAAEMPNVFFAAANALSISVFSSSGSMYTVLCAMYILNLPKEESLFFSSLLRSPSKYDLFAPLSAISPYLQRISFFIIFSFRRYTNFEVKTKNYLLYEIFVL